MRSMNSNVIHLVAALRSAIQTVDGREQAVRRFQEVVWEGEKLRGDPADVDIASELAHDLEYYVPDPVMRAEDPAYYGDEELLRRVNDVGKRLGIS